MNDLDHLLIGRILCDKCGRKITPYHMNRHIGSKECQKNIKRDAKR